VRNLRGVSICFLVVLGVGGGTACLNAVGVDTDGGVKPDAGPGPTDAGRQMTAITIDPPVGTAAVGTSLTLKATAAYSDGSTSDVTALATWSSQPTGIVMVTGGQVTAVKPGQATVEATIGPISGTAQVTVPNAVIQTIALTPLSAQTAIGGTVTFTAVASLSDGSHQDVTKSATWVSSNAAVASVSSQGLVRGLSAGMTQIEASILSVSGTAPVTVTGSPLQSIAVTPTNPIAATGVAIQFKATGTYADGTIADLTATSTWTSSNPATAKIDSTGHAVTAAAGVTTISAAAGGQTGTSLLTVTQAILTAIAVSPSSPQVAVGGSVALTATGQYSDSTTADLTAVATWSSSAPTVAAVSNTAPSNGVVTGRTAGSATITATVGSIQGSTGVTVDGSVLASLAISPSSASLPAGTQKAFRATATYSDGTMIDATTQVSWSTDAPAIAAVSNATGSAGVVTAVSSGSTTLRAMLSGVVASASIQVTNASLTSITVTPPSLSLSLGTTQPMTATGDYSDGSSVDLTSTAVWTSSNASIAAVSNAAKSRGLLTATGAGTATITATVGMISGTSMVTVMAPAPQSITLTPANPNAGLGGLVTFTATAIYPNNVSQNVTNLATWSSSNSTIATVSATGVASALAAGTAIISATYQGATGSTNLTVGSATLDHISVTPSSPQLAVGVYTGLLATAVFTDGTVTDVTNQAMWTSSNPSIATAASQGVVNAVAPGTAKISATWHGVSGSTEVTVTSAALVAIHVDPASITLPVGVTDYFSAQAVYADKSSQDITELATWSSTAPNVADAQLSTFYGGIVTSVAAGQATIRVAFGGLIGTSAVTVTSATLSAVQITPSDPSVPIGTTFQAAATAVFSDNSTQDVTYEASWTSGTPSVLDVGDSDFTPPYNGQASALSPGTATVTAAWHGVTGSTTVTVTAATLKSIQITPFALTLPVGYGTYIQATGIYSDNSTQDLTFTASFTSDTPSVATVGTLYYPGRITTYAPGTTNITATYQGVIGTEGITVTNATLASINVTPATGSVAVGAILPFTAQGKFSDGSTLDITADATWFSSATNVAEVSNAADWGTSGQTTGIAVGTATISAVSGTVTGTAQLTVQ
jgi:trimeric autotransporter adhesin